MDAKNLKQTRENLGLSQAKLGELLDVSGNTIARWERGEIPIVHPQMLKLALGAIEIGLLQNDKDLKKLENEVAEKMKKLDRIKVGRPPSVKI